MKHYTRWFRLRREQRKVVADGFERWANVRVWQTRYVPKDPNLVWQDMQSGTIRSGVSAWGDITEPVIESWVTQGCVPGTNMQLEQLLWATHT